MQATVKSPRPMASVSLNDNQNVKNNVIILKKR